MKISSYHLCLDNLCHIITNEYFLYFNSTIYRQIGYPIKWTLWGISRGWFLMRCDELATKSWENPNIGTETESSHRALWTHLGKLSSISTLKGMWIYFIYHLSVFSVSWNNSLTKGFSPFSWLKASAFCVFSLWPARFCMNWVKPGWIQERRG